MTLIDRVGAIELDIATLKAAIAGDRRASDAERLLGDADAKADIAAIRVSIGRMEPEVTRNTARLDAIDLRIAKWTGGGVVAVTVLTTGLSFIIRSLGG